MGSIEIRSFKCRVCGCSKFSYMHGVSLMYCNQCSSVFFDEQQFSLPDIGFKKLINDEYVEPVEPKNIHGTDTGYDLFSIESKIVKPGVTEMIKTGICVQFPFGMGAEVRPRSGLAYKHGIMVTNSPGTIDNEYRNEIRVLLYNSGKEDYEVKVHDKIAQLVFEYTVLPTLIEVKEFGDETSRNLGGFGSTGE